MSVTQDGYGLVSITNESKRDYDKKDRRNNDGIDNYFALEVQVNKSDQTYNYFSKEATKSLRKCVYWKNVNQIFA